ncbi:MAG TPA: ABC transporter substrate-binding protein [Magnetococcales bacterium]|nr:ABC transporter substrate-binding protein [Magnetococcales bacterium]
MWKVLKWVVIALVGIGVGVFFTSALFRSKPGQNPDSNLPLRVAINPWPGSAHIFIAEKMGYFTKNGVAVQIRLTRSQEDSSAIYKNGEVDGLGDVLSNTIVYGSEGVPTRVVYVADYSQSGDCIIAKPKFTSLADLKGGRVAFEGINSFSQLYVLKALETQGLDESMVRFEMVSSQDVLAALEEDRIDAGHTWEPTTSRALAKGYRILSSAGDIPGIITDVYAFHNRIVDQRPQAIQAFVKSMVEARIYVGTHREESLAIMAQATGMSVAEMNNGLAGVVPLDLKANIQALTPGDNSLSLHNSGEFIIQFLLKRGQLRIVPELNRLLDVQFVRALSSKEPSP